jgi:hypothetical protein
VRGKYTNGSGPAGGCPKLPRSSRNADLLCHDNKLRIVTELERTQQ